MRRRVAVFTGTRAEYGLLYWLMKGIANSQILDLQVIVSGTHLSPEFGETWKQIDEDGFVIDAKVEMLLSSDTSVGIAKSIGLATVGYADALDRLKPDVLVVLGDRFEALAIAQAALVMRIPLAHLHGGEITEGAYDDSIRHAITKMSTLHFVSAECYLRRVIQMGEAPATVFNVGAIGLDHVLRTPRLTLQELSDSFNFTLRKPYFLVTYHPVTVAEESEEKSFQAMLDALDMYPEYQIIITFPNADNGGRKIISMLEAYAQTQPDRVLAISSLGFIRYLSAMAQAAAVVGNSSSGIIEAPSFGVPTVNIGYRQKGRLSAESVVHCASDFNGISTGLKRALSDEFLIGTCRNVINPYGQGEASKQIVQILEIREVNVQKSFYDLKVSI